MVVCLAGSAFSLDAATIDHITPDQNQTRKRAATHQGEHGLSLSGDQCPLYPPQASFLLGRILRMTNEDYLSFAPAVTDKAAIKTSS